MNKYTYNKPTTRPRKMVDIRIRKDTYTNNRNITNKLLNEAKSRLYGGFKDLCLYQAMCMELENGKYLALSPDYMLIGFGFTPEIATQSLKEEIERQIKKIEHGVRRHNIKDILALCEKYHIDYDKLVITHFYLSDETFQNDRLKRHNFVVGI